ncbi:MAG: hypothetical protein HYZ81_27130, partial [Nitrospinae bacterium]|nr:hypothetical protein [Nitrospinota bacterium]
MVRRTFLLACVSLVVLAGCGGGGGGGGGGPTLVDLTTGCSLQGQAVSCTNPGSQTVTTLTPEVAVSFVEPMNRDSVGKFVDVNVKNLIDGT